MAKTAIVAARKVNSKILILRGQRVILDADLAELYGVKVRHLNQQVKRNAKRFPLAFRFQLSAQEFKILRSQNVISSQSHGGTRYRPYAFTEHGAIMAATVLNSERADRNERLRRTRFCSHAPRHCRPIGISWPSWLRSSAVWRPMTPTSRI